MRSLALQHKAKALAKEQAAQSKRDAKAIVANKSTAEPTGLAGLDFAVVDAHFKRDQEKVKVLDDVSEKIELKKKLLPDYVKWLEQYQVKGERYPNPVLSMVIFWLIDTDDLPNAFKFAKLAIEQQQIKPENFKRDLTTAIVEEIHGWCERQFKSENSPEPFLTDTCNLCIQGEWLVSEIIVLNKLYKLRGMVAEKTSDYETALKMYQLCVEVNPEKHGCKNRISTMQAKLKKQKDAK